MSKEIRSASLGASREENYASLLPQIEALLAKESDLIACLANLSASLRTTFGFFWVGFYLVRDQELVLGPFQGPVACSRINRGEGVCGKAWVERRTIIVPNVALFQGHISCSKKSRSEIVVPYPQDNSPRLVLDIDSSRLNEFNEVDAKYLLNLLQISLSGVRNVVRIFKKSGLLSKNYDIYP